MIRCARRSGSASANSAVEDNGAQRPLCNSFRQECCNSSLWSVTFGRFNRSWALASGALAIGAPISPRGTWRVRGYLTSIFRLFASSAFGKLTSSTPSL